MKYGNDDNSIPKEYGPLSEGVVIEELNFGQRNLKVRWWYKNEAFADINSELNMDVYGSYVMGGPALIRNKLREMAGNQIRISLDKFLKDKAKAVKS